MGHAFSFCKTCETPLDCDFCPNCGAPMTDEAVEIIMERLEETT